MRTIAAALLMVLAMTQSVLATDWDMLWASVRDRGPWAVQGNTYAPTRTGVRSQRWDCTTCVADQDIRAGFYDFAVNYDTTDVDKVMGMVTRGCGFKSCVTKPYERFGLTGLSQTGIKRDQAAKRTILFIEDRMLLVEVRGSRNAAEMSLLQYAAETEILTELLKVR